MNGHNTADDDIGSAEENVDNATVNEVIEVGVSKYENDYETGDTSIVSLKTKIEDFGLHVIKCAMNLKEKHVLPAVVRQSILEQIKFVPQQIHEMYSMLFKAFCDESQVALPADSKYTCMLNESSVFCQIFDEIA